MLTIQNLDKISHILLVDDKWMLYPTISTSPNRYSFLVLKNHSSIEVHPNYTINIHRQEVGKRGYKVSVSYNREPGARPNLFWENTICKETLSDKTEFIKVLEDIIINHKP